MTEVGRLREAADAVGALLVLDGAQRAPHGPLDVQALGCDLYAFSAHKMFGPTGAGALWGRKELLAELPPFLGRRGDDPAGRDRALDLRRCRRTASRPARPPIGPVIGMGAAAAWLATLDWAALGRQEIELTARILDGLGSLPRCAGSRAPPARRPASASCRSASTAPIRTISARLLDEVGVCLRGGHHCAQPLMDAFDLPATARASLAPYNDAADVDALVAGLDRAIARLR